MNGRLSYLLHHARSHFANMSCCIKECVNSSGPTAEFPRDEKLLTRWLLAIHAGTGQHISDEEIKNGLRICSMHFGSSLQMPHDLNNERVEYSEPSFFVRDGVQLEVTSCRLCLRHDLKNFMYNMEDNLTQKYTLQWLATKFFGLILTTKSRLEEGYFCQRCLIRIDMTHTFWQEMCYSAVEYESLLEKTSNKCLLFNDGSGYDDVVDFDVEVKIESYDSDTPLPEGIEALAELIVQEDQSATDDLSTAGHPETPSVNSKSQKFRCNICHIGFESKKLQYNHLLFEHGTRDSFWCPVCGLHFRHVTLYNMHLSKHDATRNIKHNCRHCTRKFTRVTDRIKHEEHQHGVKAPEVTAKIGKEKKNCCLICGNTYPTKPDLLRHQMRHYKGDKVICEKHCQKAFPSIRHLEYHLKVVRKKLALQKREPKPRTEESNNKDDLILARTCLECKAQFTSRYEYNRHRRMHTTSLLPDGKPCVSRDCPSGATCNVCSEKLAHSRDVLGHFVEAHPEIELKCYPCADCDEVFFTTSTLHSHHYIHSDTFACEECGKRHYSSRELIRHRFNTHLDAPTEEQDARQQKKCSICQKFFPAGKIFDEHRRSHDKFTCKECDKQFVHRRSLTKHKKAAH